jgi:hypothetical protein
MHRLGAHERDRFTELDERFQLLSLFGRQTAIRISIHEKLQPLVILRGKTQSGHCLNHLKRGLHNRTHPNCLLHGDTMKHERTTFPQYQNSGSNAESPTRR